jgi:hypothetical protein
MNTTVSNTPGKNAKNTYSDKQLLEFNKNSQLKGTFKLIRCELLEFEGLDKIHRSILEATKTMPNVYKMLIDVCTKLGKEKNIYYRLGVLRALNNYDKALQELIAENKKKANESKKTNKAVKVGN